MAAMIRELEGIEARLCFIERHIGMRPGAWMKFTRRLLDSLADDPIKALERLPWPMDTTILVFPREYAAPLEDYRLCLVDHPDIGNGREIAAAQFIWKEDAGLRFAGWS